MARIERKTGYGNAPETVGWKKLMVWLAKKGNTMSALARAVNVAQPSSFAWRWRKSIPGGDVRIAVCDVIGAEPEDWERAVRNRRSGKAA